MKTEDPTQDPETDSATGAEIGVGSGVGTGIGNGTIAGSIDDTGTSVRTSDSPVGGTGSLSGANATPKQIEGHGTFEGGEAK